MNARELSIEKPGARAPAPSADLRVAIGSACIGYVLASLGGCLILLARDLGVARSELSWLSAGFGVALLAVGFAGRALLHRGPEPLLRVASAIMAAGAVLLAVARSLPFAQAGTLLVGLGSAGIVLAAPALLTGRAAAARLARVNAWSSLSGILAPILIGVVDGLSGNGRLALLLVAPALAWLAAQSSMPSPSEPNAVDRTPAERARPGRVLVHWLSMVAAVSAEFAFVVWGAARLADSGLDAAGASAAAAAFPIGMGAGRFFAPRFIDRIPASMVGALLGIAGGLVVAAPVSPMLLAAAMALAGLGIAPLYPLTLARLVSTPGLGLQLGSGLGAVASGTAIVCAPILLDRLALRVGLRTGFLVVVPALLAVICLGRLAARKP
jgi:hypothetical protein